MLCAPQRARARARERESQCVSERTAFGVSRRESFRAARHPADGARRSIFVSRALDQQPLNKNPATSAHRPLRLPVLQRVLSLRHTHTADTLEHFGCAGKASHVHSLSRIAVAIVCPVRSARSLASRLARSAPRVFLASTAIRHRRLGHFVARTRQQRSALGPTTAPAQRPTPSSFIASSYWITSAKFYRSTLTSHTNYTRPHTTPSSPNPTRSHR